MRLHAAVHAGEFVRPAALMKRRIWLRLGQPRLSQTPPKPCACAQDYQHIEQGYYSLPWDMVETRNRQWSPLHVARRSAQVVPVPA